jgi:HD-like signal output (HDOD) protein
MADGSVSDTTRGGVKSVTSDEFLEKLRTALSRNGDFPASAKIVTELRMLTSDPQTTAAQIAEVILREPSLGVRVLHLVNSSYYKRVKPITSISQAIVQIGMKPLAEMCSGLVLLQRFVPEARKSSAFASCLRKSIVTSLLSSSLALQSTNATLGKNAANKNAESGFLAGTMAEIGILLMAYYFPQVYESALKRSETKRQDIALSVQQLIGLSPSQLSAEVIRTLDLPQYYADIVMTAENFLTHGVASSATLTADVVESGRFLCAAIGISDALTGPQSEKNLLEAVQKIRERLSLKPDVLQTVINSLSKGLEEHCSALEVALPPIPVALETMVISAAGTFSKESETTEDTPPAALNLGPQQAAFDEYIEDIKQALINNEPTASIVTSVMEACAYCLNFNRVILLLASQGRKNLVGRMVLGTIPDIDTTKYSRPLGDDADPYAPDNNAFTQGRPIFQGDPLFPGGWPIAALPIGSGKKAVGVVYAEKTGGTSPELTPQEQAAIVILTGLLDKSLQRVVNKIS